MPDTRRHRGAHPDDAVLFSPAAQPALREGMRDLCWLLDHGYALRSALALAGDRHALTQRQRIALARSACSEEQRRRRREHEIDPAAMRGAEIWIDGYNLLITIEAALGGGVVLIGRDGTYRDLASLHGTYRQVSETIPAVTLAGTALTRWGFARCHWLLDRPVSNSGRLKTLLLEIAARAGWDWDVQLEFSPDKVLGEVEGLVVSADSVVLDRCGRWVNVAREIVCVAVPGAQVIDLRVA